MAVRHAQIDSFYCFIIIIIIILQSAPMLVCFCYDSSLVVLLSQLSENVLDYV